MLTLTAMSVDRLLAMILGPRYRQLVTLKRVWILVAFFGFIMLRFRPYCFTSRHFFLLILHRAFVVCNNLKLLLLENISHTSPTSSSSSRPCPPRKIERRNSNQYDTIQEDGVQCIMGEDNIYVYYVSIRLNNSCPSYY